jgi:hypothetical protein
MACFCLGVTRGPRGLHDLHGVVDPPHHSGLRCPGIAPNRSLAQAKLTIIAMLELHRSTRSQSSVLMPTIERGTSLLGGLTASSSFPRRLGHEMASQWLLFFLIASML